jgi:hypothetical protein
MVFAYTFSAVPNGPKSLYVQTSDDGLLWTAQVLVNAEGDSNVPQIDRGPSLGTFASRGKTTGRTSSTRGTRRVRMAA